VNLTYLSPLANHLWQSTVFAGVAGLLTLALRNNRARVRHWVWLVASCKFLVPLSLLIALGAHIQWRGAPEMARSDLSIAMAEASQPFTLSTGSSRLAEAAPVAASFLPALLWGIWACGFLGIAAAWWVRWRRLRTAIACGTPEQVELALPVVCVSTLVEPGVFGIFRPILLLPKCIFGRLTPAQLEAVITHELCHVRHQDNLIAAVHMFVETAFWFHPLVWWIGKRMVEERERACDQEVLRLGSEPRVYAEGILSICKLYAELPLACVSGVTGADLKKRIESIMRNRALLRLDLTRKAVLAAAGVAAVAVPIAVGIVNASFVRAQSSADQRRLTFDVASVKPASVPPAIRVMDDGKVGVQKGSGVSIPRNTGGPGTDDPGRIHYPLITLKQLLRRAWDSYYEIDGPGWLDSRAVTVDATMPPDTTKAQFQEMLRNLITERFGLHYHTGKKEIIGYALVIARNGPKLEASAEQGEAENAPPKPPTGMGKDGFPIYPPGAGKKLVTDSMDGGRSRIMGQRVTIQALAENLSRKLKATVTDMTGLAAKYDFTLTYAAVELALQPANNPEGLEPLPDLFAALQSQLGLKLERKPVPVEVFVVDQMKQTPTGN
jgi:bla regulator protein BlaR1